MTDISARDLFCFYRDNDEPAIFSLQRSLQASDAVQVARVLSGNTSNTNSQIGAAQINIMLFTTLIHL